MPRYTLWVDFTHASEGGQGDVNNPSSLKLEFDDFDTYVGAVYRAHTGTIEPEEILFVENGMDVLVSHDRFLEGMRAYDQGLAGLNPTGTSIEEEPLRMHLLNHANRLLITRDEQETSLTQDGPSDEDIFDIDSPSGSDDDDTDGDGWITPGRDEASEWEILSAMSHFDPVGVLMAAGRQVVPAGNHVRPEDIPAKVQELARRDPKAIFVFDFDDTLFLHADQGRIPPGFKATRDRQYFYSPELEDMDIPVIILSANKSRETINEKLEEARVDDVENIFHAIRAEKKVVFIKDHIQSGCPGRMVHFFDNHALTAQLAEGQKDITVYHVVNQA